MSSGADSMQTQTGAKPVDSGVLVTEIEEDDSAPVVITRELSALDTRDMMNLLCNRPAYKESLKNDPDSATIAETRDMLRSSNSRHVIEVNPGIAAIVRIMGARAAASVHDDALDAHKMLKEGGPGRAGLARAMSSSIAASVHLNTLNAISTLYARMLILERDQDAKPFPAHVRTFVDYVDGAMSSMDPTLKRQVVASVDRVVARAGHFGAELDGCMAELADLRMRVLAFREPAIMAMTNDSEYVVVESAPVSSTQSTDARS